MVTIAARINGVVPVLKLRLGRSLFIEDLLIVESSAIGDSESFGVLVKRETDDPS